MWGKVRVTVEEQTRAGVACLAVAVEGIGIPAEHGSICGRLMRAAIAKRVGISETGVGLYLCRELVEPHGGRIGFESGMGKGSTFFVEVPSVRDDEVNETARMNAGGYVRLAEDVSEGGLAAARDRVREGAAEGEA
jgi:signal transduction histidine kinase